MRIQLFYWRIAERFSQRYDHKGDDLFLKSHNGVFGLCRILQPLNGLSLTHKMRGVGLNFVSLTCSIPAHDQERIFEANKVFARII